MALVRKPQRRGVGRKTLNRRSDDPTLQRRRDRILEGVKFSGHSQIDLLLSMQLVEALGNPPMLKGKLDSTGVVRLMASWEGGFKIRRTSWSRLVSSVEIARLLWHLDPQGRYFDISRVEGPVGAREALITRGDVVAVYTYHRFRPGEPFLSPVANRAAGEEYDRSGVVPAAQYQVPEPGPQPVDKSVDSQKTVQPDSPSASTVNQTATKTPLWQREGYGSFEAWVAAIQDRDLTDEEYEALQQGAP